MSKNALALVDCSNRDKLFHYLINTVDRKSTKKEMISPYDDQLIGKMNFRYSGVEHAMFFTYARSSEYPGMKFRNHKIIYLSLDVNEISSAIFNHICNRFGGYIIHNDDVEEVWQKVERQQSENDDDLTLSEEVIAERSFLYEPEEEGKERKVFRELKLEPDVEEEAEEREWAPPVTESKPEKKAEHKKHEKKQEHKQEHKAENKQEQREKREAGKSNKGYRGSRVEIQVTAENKDENKPDAKGEQKPAPKITVRETLRSHERQKEQKEQKEQKKATQKDNRKEPQKEAVKQDGTKNETAKHDAENGKDNPKPHHRRGHRGGRKHSGKSAGKEQNPQNGQNATVNHKPQTQKTDA